MTETAGKETVVALTRWPARWRSALLLSETEDAYAPCLKTPVRTVDDGGHGATMATTYGFRLYKIGLRREFGRKPVNFAKCDGQHFADVVESLLKELSETNAGKPKLRHDSSSDIDTDQEESDSEPELAGEPAFRVESSGRTTWIVHGTFFAGKFGEHEIALGMPNKAEDMELTDRAPSRLHRYVIAVPEDGESGILAIESIGRTCPVNLFTSWLARRSQVQAETGAEESSDQEGKPSWWKLQWTPLADNEQLEKLIRDGKFNKIELIKHVATSDNQREKEYFRLVAPRIEDESVSEVTGFVREWWDRRRGVDPERAPATDNEAADQLASIFGANVQELDFDDGFVRIDDGGGDKKISPSRMSEIFIYPLSLGERAENSVFYRAIRDKSRSVSITSQVDVDWPDSVNWAE